MGASSDCGGSGGSAAGGGSASSNSSTSSGNSGTKTFTVGQAVKASDGNQVTITSFQRNYKSTDEFSQPETGKECVVVNLAIQAGSSEWMAPTTEFTVVDAGGQKYNEDFGHCNTSTSIDSLVAGGHATATMYYEVPAGTALNFTWQPNLFESTVFQAALK